MINAQTVWYAVLPVKSDSVCWLYLVRLLYHIIYMSVFTNFGYSHLELNNNDDVPDNHTNRVIKVIQVDQITWS